MAPSMTERGRRAARSVAQPDGLRRSARYAEIVNRLLSTYVTPSSERIDLHLHISDLIQASALPNAYVRLAVAMAAPKSRIEYENHTQSSNKKNRLSWAARCKPSDGRGHCKSTAGSTDAARHHYILLRPVEALRCRQRDHHVRRHALLLVGQFRSIQVPRTVLLPAADPILKQDGIR
jgi:hypothetical protein